MSVRATASSSESLRVLNGDGRGVKQRPRRAAARRVSLAWRSLVWGVPARLLCRVRPGSTTSLPPQRRKSRCQPPPLLSCGILLPSHRVSGRAAAGGLMCSLVSAFTTRWGLDTWSGGGGGRARGARGCGGGRGRGHMVLEHRGLRPRVRRVIRAKQGAWPTLSRPCPNSAIGRKARG